MAKRIVLLLLLGVPLIFADSTPRVPAVDDLLMVKSLRGTQISPDGKWVAYVVSETDFKQDAFVSQIWLADTTSGALQQLTRGDKSSAGPSWSPDGRWLAFTSSRNGGKEQIFAIRPDGGEAVQLTKSDSAVNSLAWSPDGKSIAFVATDPEPQFMKDRKDYLGEFTVVRKEYAHAHLWTFDVAEALQAPVAGKQRTRGKDFTVGSYSWSPDAARIAFSATLNPDLIQGNT
ncbi:MAG: DPP IV N-terminal domain-containing protein, partial [Acidobacteriota bacterium]